MVHGHGHSGDAAARALAISVVLHAIVMVLEAVVGWFSGSLALLSDAGHMMSDVGTLTLAYLAQRLRAREPRGYTYGLRRLPVLGGLANALGLVLVVTLITLEAVERIGEPPDVLGGPTLAVALLGLAVNLGGVWLIHRADDHSVNVRSALVHVIADALGSVAAVVSAVLVMTVGWMHADPIASLIIALMIAGASVPLFAAAGRILLQGAPADVDIDAVREAMLADPNVTELQDLHLWELDSKQRVLSAVVCCSDDTLTLAAETADRLRMMLHDRFDVDHATLELRPPTAPEPHHHF